ncbi:lytic transglycosylase domain-containing protein [Psychrobacter sp.]|uniref:lytic transglycosylase domain-containing protein n=1 Tax=Psychrobacter sp. TaxID=56811 RepID=UPI0025D38008|nr:lytic transglycosylase domain-containing protein [Psychrobacter sp.]
MSALLNKVLTRSANLVAGSILISSSILAANAGNMYIYKDESGQVLLTNVNPSDNFNKYSKKVKVNYYPNSGADLTATNTLTIKEPSYFSSLNSRSFSDMPNSASISSSVSIGSGNNLYDYYIIASAKRNNIDPALLKAIMHTESSFNPNARSPVGALGLMQLMPATARRFSVINAWNPSENIEGAAKYVAWLSRRFNGKIEHVLAGYNAGEGNVDKYGGVPPFTETRNYVQRVLSRYNNLYKNDSSLFSTAADTSIDPSYTSTNYSVSSTSFATTNNSYTQ